jgi:hypothetical protein
MTSNAKFFVEVTDTYGGEANYAWVHRFLVNATTERGAMTKVARQTGYRFRKDWGSSDLSRYKARGAHVCAFLSHFDEHHAQYSVATL